MGQSLVFNVQSCAEARIALSPSPNLLAEHAYLVILGEANNEISRVVKDMASNATGKEMATPQVLDCQEMRVSMQLWGDEGNAAVGR